MEDTVTALAFQGTDKCTGVTLQSGRTLHADRSLLCTGANTAKLLADSAPQWKELQADGRLVAAGVVIADVNLTGEQLGQLEGIPVFVGGMPYTEGRHGLVACSTMVRLMAQNR